MNHNYNDLPDTMRYILHLNSVEWSRCRCPSNNVTSAPDISMLTVSFRSPGAMEDHHCCCCCCCCCCFCCCCRLLQPVVIESDDQERLPLVEAKRGAMTLHEGTPLPLPLPPNAWQGDVYRAWSDRRSRYSAAIGRLREIRIIICLNDVPLRDDDQRRQDPCERSFLYIVVSCGIRRRSMIYQLILVV